MATAKMMILNCCICILNFLGLVILFVRSHLVQLSHYKVHSSISRKILRNTLEIRSALISNWELGIRNWELGSIRDRALPIAYCLLPNKHSRLTFHDSRKYCHAQNNSR